MKKEDIIKMKTSKEIMQTLFTDSNLWDEEVNEHLKSIARKEKLKAYGSEAFMPTPNRCEVSDK